ncbi:MAG: class I mannose-6-phosphate isomerase, partial [Kiritimatiellaeota bacterium]|nr:class I mannose-6-phosphate isomerase [Kiritimatiellota bacterium]
MITLPTPLLFKPVYKDYLWGGNRLPPLYARAGAPERCAESWEIAAHKDGDSIVQRGPLSGRTLSDLTALYGAALVGTRAPDPLRFPLLFKLIDAREKLSVQVHPSNANAELTNGEPKTEMWYLLDPTMEVRTSELQNGSTSPPSLYAGFCPGTTPDALREAVGNSTADHFLITHRATPGGTLFIPGGLVHAIGEGCLIYEVQQNSNTTFRLYDWDRIGGQGKPRRLHIEQCFKSIDWTLP